MQVALALDLTIISTSSNALNEECGTRKVENLLLLLFISHYKIINFLLSLYEVLLLMNTFKPAFLLLTKLHANANRSSIEFKKGAKQQEKKKQQLIIINNP